MVVENIIPRTTTIIPPPSIPSGPLRCFGSRGITAIANRIVLLAVPRSDHRRRPFQDGRHVMAVHAELAGNLLLSEPGCIDRQHVEDSLAAPLLALVVDLASETVRAVVAQ